ncbi:Scr1 family TA system antitoxin-like transcriptional regulator [Amycolatopsis sp. cmx-8-4]|uniref:Scr1 family TA system antitoxin-like transcriptional regulator n=1 Tax=Amycolatopsis sp. cmx-8-4 TaxID=2790947 RepID=UPI00397DB154
MSIETPRPAVIAVAHTLRKIREQRGLSLRHVARMAKISASKLSGLETGGRRQNITLVAYLLGIIGAPIETLNHILEIADHGNEPDFLDPSGRDENLLRAAFEQLSRHVFEWSPSLFPRTLRSAEYSDAIQKSGLPEGDPAVKGFIPAAACTRPTGVSEPLHSFLLGEAATRPGVCSPEVLYNQIEEVATVSKLMPISISVVPASYCSTGLVEPFTLYEGHTGAIAVVVKHQRGVAFLTNKISLKHYTKTAQWLRSGRTDNPWP